MRRLSRLLSLIAVIGILIFFTVLACPLFTGSVYTEDDLSAFSLPLRHFYHRCLHEGDSPIWIPSMFCGFYLHGEGQAGLYHPLHYLLYRFLPLGPAFNLEMLASYFVLFSGTYLLLRRRTLPAHAALFGAMLFTFCGFNLTNYLHIMIPAVIAHVPWLLLGLDSLWRARTPRACAVPAVAIALLTASQLLVGFPQCVYHSLLIEGLYLLLLIHEDRSTFRSSVARIGILATAKVLALLCGAVQVLPQMEAARHSIRLAPSFEFIMAGSLHPANLLQIFSPYLFNRRGWTPDLAQLWDPPYFTALTPVLIIWAIMRYRRLDAMKRPLVAGAMIMAVAGLVLALGYYGYLYRLYAFIPWLNKFRNSSRHILLFHLGVSAVVAVAYADLARMAARGERGMRLAWLWLPAFLGVLIALTATAIHAQSNFPSVGAIARHLAPVSNAWFGALLFCIASAVVFLAARGCQYAIPALLLLAIADMALYGLRHRPAENLEAFIRRIEVPGDCGDYRIDPDFRPVWAYNGAPMRGCSVVSGYAALFPIDRLDYRGGQIAALRAAGCKWRKTRLGGPTELAEAHDRGIAWIEVPDPVSRVRCVTKCVASDNPARDIESLDLASTVLADVPIFLPESDPGKAALIFDRPGKIGVEVEVPATQILAVTERYHQGWDAEIDGKPAEIVRVNGDFMGCVVGKGKHSVRFIFAPDDLRRGKALSTAGLCLTALFGAVLARAGKTVTI